MLTTIFHLSVDILIFLTLHIYLPQCHRPVCLRHISQDEPLSPRKPPRDTLPHPPPVSAAHPTRSVVSVKVGHWGPSPPQAIRKQHMLESSMLLIHCNSK